MALYAVLYGYKGLLQVFALLLAFSTRKVKVKGLNDSKYIAAAIYVTSIVLAVTIVSTYTLMDHVSGRGYRLSAGNHHDPCPRVCSKSECIHIYSCPDNSVC